MNNYKCAFSGALMSNHFVCRNALQITRRDGPSFGCINEQVHIKCDSLYHVLRTTAIPALGYKDDLTQLPHSILMKIQIGGLSGLQQMFNSGTDNTVMDVHELIHMVEQKYEIAGSVPLSDILYYIKTCKIRRRK